MAEQKKKIIWIAAVVVALLLIAALLLLLDNGEAPPAAEEPTTTQEETTEATKPSETTPGETAEGPQEPTVPETTAPEETESATEPSETEPNTPTNPSGSDPTTPATPTTPTNPTTSPNPTTPADPTTPNAGSQDNSYPEPTENNTIIPVKSSLSARIGEKIKIEVLYTGNKKLQYYTTCKFPVCFSVSQDGTACGNLEGNYTVHVTDGTYTAEISIMVSEYPYSTGLFFMKEELTLEVGKSVLVKTNETIDPYWITSLDKSIVTVSGNYVTGQKPGKTIIRASNGFASCAMPVTVIPASNQGSVLKLTETNLAMYVGEDHQFVCNYTGDKGLQWESSNLDIARVDENGKIHTYGEGTVQISVTDGVMAHACTITVTVRPGVLAESMEIVHRNGLCRDGATKYVGDHVKIKLQIKPYYATDNIIFECSDRSIIGIEEEDRRDHIYKLVFKKAGTATVTFRTADGAKTLRYTFHVKAGYDFDPGDGAMTPEVFADYVNRVMASNGIDVDPNVSGWLMGTISKEKELNFDYAVQTAYSFYHTWWWNLLGDHPDGISLWYEYVGTNEYGNYVFKEHR